MHTMERLVIVGLGNAGEQFASTRHNIGIEVVRRWTTAHADSLLHEWRHEPRFLAEIASLVRGQLRIICFFPLTMMNDSGRAVASFCNYESVSPADIVLVHDDLELELGEVKQVAGGSARGHNGVRSVHSASGTDQLLRVRLGIGRPAVEIPVERFVLSRFTPAEQVGRERLLQEGQAVLERIVDERLLNVGTKND